MRTSSTSFLFAKGALNIIASGLDQCLAPKSAERDKIGIAWGDVGARDRRRDDLIQIICRAFEHLDERRATSCTFLPFEDLDSAIEREDHLPAVMTRGVKQRVLAIDGLEGERLFFGQPFRPFADFKTLAKRMREIGVGSEFLLLDFLEIQPEGQRDHDRFEEPDRAGQVPVDRQPCEDAH